jgi:hypothetical protein
MKKLLLLYCFMAVTQIGFTQARLGSTLADLKSEYKNSCELKTEYIDGDTKVDVVCNQFGATHYIKNGVVYLSYTYYWANSTLQGKVQNLNNTYVIINPKTWHWYDQGNIIEIKLLRIDQVDLFQWSYLN